MPFITFKRSNAAQATQMRTPPARNGLKWAAVGGVVLGFLGVMKITGNLNREFFVELMMARDSKTPEGLNQHQQKEKSDTSKQSPLPPGTEATIIIK